MTKEKLVSTVSGWVVLALLLLLAAGCAWMIVGSIDHGRVISVWRLVVGIILSMVWLVLLFGFFTLQPNISAVLLLFGEYKGTTKDSGFRWTNPFMSVKKVSMRAHNLNGERLKVNDNRGNPIEIAVVVVWRVQNTAEACFDVEDYAEYVTVQSESAVRHLATKYPYDNASDEAELTLRGSIDEVSHDLQGELSDRLGKAGVIVDEARISHLAYAQEIAGAMLQRQQAQAIVAARRLIVEGAVGMVEMALEHLEKNNTVTLDEERKAAMVSNLLVVLCGDKAAHPVVNTGSLY